MRRIHIEPSWSFADQQGATVDPKLFTLLRAVHEHRRLSAAATALGCSYRHTWNLLSKWSGFFGADVVLMQRGRGATLTPLGEKLLWAEQRVSARLKPQLDSLASEINLELRRALADTRPLLRMCASHGYAVALLPDFAHQFQLDLQYDNPLGALTALNRGSCEVAGFHVPRNISIPSLFARYRQLLNSREHIAIRFVTREQGLVVAAGNPKGIVGIESFRDGALRFINRQQDSGSRYLIDTLFAQAGVDTRRVTGYGDQEFTHGAIAAYVAAGMADAGFCVEAAARQFKLDFIPLTTEDYVLVCRRRDVQERAVVALLEQMRAPTFLAAIDGLPGYHPVGCGDLEEIDALWP